MKTARPPFTPQNPEIVLVVAMAENHVIGGDNKLLWHLNADLKRFRHITTGHPMIMGRKTFESIGRALPERTTIILSHAINLQLPEEVLHASSPEEAMSLAQKDAEKRNIASLMVVGGGEIYRQFLPIANRLEITRVVTNIAGDTVFPLINEKLWKKTDSIAFEADHKNQFAYIFETYLRACAQ